MVSDAAKKETSNIWTRVLMFPPVVGLILAIISWVILGYILNSELSMSTKFVLSICMGLLSFALGISIAFYGTHLVRVSYAKKFCEAL